MSKYKGLIVVLEGPDGVGKSTLANVIAEVTKGSVLHAYYKKDWDIEEYHIALFANAMMLSRYTPIILDRWAPSEYVYGTVFREKPSYDVPGIIDEAIESAARNDIKMVWVYCRNENVVKNHEKNKKSRDEMFDNMEKVQEEFDNLVQSNELGWMTYDFDKNGSPDEMRKFINKITEGVNE